MESGINCWNRKQFFFLLPKTLSFTKCSRMLYISESFIKIFRNLCFDTETHCRFLPPLYCVMVPMFLMFYISFRRDMGKIFLRLMPLAIWQTDEIDLWPWRYGLCWGNLELW